MHDGHPTTLKAPLEHVVLRWAKNYTPNMVWSTAENVHIGLQFDWSKFSKIYNFPELVHYFWFYSHFEIPKHFNDSCKQLKYIFLFFFLTLYHTIPTFNNLEKEDFWKHCETRRKCWKPAFSPFPKLFSTLPNTNFNLLLIFILSSANTLNSDQSKILLFGSVNELALKKKKIVTFFFYK